MTCSWWRLALAVALAGGCNDGEGGDSGGSSDTAAAAEPVRYSGVETYLPLGGEPIAIAKDPEAGGDDLHIEQDGQVFEGVYDGKAWLVFDGVPEGTFQLHRHYAADPELPGAPSVRSIIETDRRDLYEGRTSSGRPDVTLASSDATGLSLDVGAMTPLGLVDRFEVRSYNVDALADLDVGEGVAPGEPLEGDDAITGWVIAWDVATTRDGPPLVDPGAGDDLWLSHLVGHWLDDWDYVDAWSDATVRTLAEAAPLALAAMVDGEQTPASGTFAPVAQRPITVDLRGSQVTATLATNLPSPDIYECRVRVILEPGIDRPVFGVPPTLGEVVLSSYDPPSDRVLAFAYGNPYPIGTEILYIRCLHWLSVPHPAADESDYVYSAIELLRPVAELDGSPIAPTLSIVQDITIDGVKLDPGSVRTGVGESPTIAFAPPTVGTAEYFSVSVVTVDDILGPGGTVLRSQKPVFGYLGEGTSVTLPAGVLEPGHYYYVRVSASNGQGLGEGRPRSHTAAYASGVTGLFTP